MNFKKSKKMHFMQFILKNVDFLKKIFTQNFLSQKKLFQNTAYLLPIKMHISRQKIISILLAFGQK